MSVTVSGLVSVTVSGLVCRVSDGVSAVSVTVSVKVSVTVSVTVSGLVCRVRDGVRVGVPCQCRRAWTLISGRNVRRLTIFANAHATARVKLDGPLPDNDMPPLLVLVLYVHTGAC